MVDLDNIELSKDKKINNDNIDSDIETLIKEEALLDNLNPPFSSNIVVNTMIEKQKVYCKNKKNGCPWIDKLSERKKSRTLREVYGI